MKDYMITGHTRMLCLLGDPVEHSKSPQMHNACFRSLGLDYSYMAYRVRVDEMEDVVKAFRIMGVRGWNITMPCKNKMAALCDHLSDAAALIGAVNCVVSDGGVLTGHNTDGVGFMRSASEHGYHPSGSKAVLMGCGGAATSIMVQLALDGCSDVEVFARKSSKHYAQMLPVIEKVTAQTGCSIHSREYSDDELRTQISSADILINATNIGMSPHEDECLVSEDVLRGSVSRRKDGQSLIVADAIYAPEKTRLICMAKEMDLTAFGGKDMLLYQGAESFRLWTGMDMPVEVARESIK